MQKNAPHPSHIACMLHMWTTAHLHRVIPNLINFDQVTVALTKESQRPLIERLLQRQCSWANSAVKVGGNPKVSKSRKIVSPARIVSPRWRNLSSCFWNSRSPRDSVRPKRSSSRVNSFRIVV